MVLSTPPQKIEAPTRQSVIEDTQRDRQLMSSIVNPRVGGGKVDLPPRNEDVYGSTERALVLHKQLGAVDDAQQPRTHGAKSFGGKKIRKNTTWKVKIRQIGRAPLAALVRRQVSRLGVKHQGAKYRASYRKRNSRTKLNRGFWR